MLPGPSGLCRSKQIAARLAHHAVEDQLVLLGVRIAVPVGVDGLQARQHLLADAGGRVERDVHQPHGRQTAQRALALHQQRPAALAGGGDRRAHPGHAAAHDDDVVFADHLQLPGGLHRTAFLHFNARHVSHSFPCCSLRSTMRIASDAHSSTQTAHPTHRSGSMCAPP